MSVGQQVSLACLLEVSAPKPGNVHRGADFEDMCLNDFLIAGTLLGNAIDSVLAADPAVRSGAVGNMILSAVSATRSALDKNPNLGICLLLCPLAAAAHKGGGGVVTQADIATVLEELGPEDCRDVYEAIRIASPGGLGKVDDADVCDRAPDDLIAAMGLAADRDLVAAQFVNDFDLVFGEASLLLSEGLNRYATVDRAVIFTHTSLMARYPDSLIARKCGEETAAHSAFLASKTVDSLVDGSSFDDEDFQAELSALDFWLRSDGNRRNPGTTADLVAATLLVAIHNGVLKEYFAR